MKACGGTKREGVKQPAPSRRCRDVADDLPTVMTNAGVTLKL
jgi:hypothetical protein